MTSRKGLLVFALGSVSAFAAPQGTYSVKQLLLSHNRVVVSFTGDLPVGTELVATMKNGSQCTLKVTGSKGSLANADTSSCPSASELQLGQKLEPSLAVEEDVVIPQAPSKEPPPAAERPSPPVVPVRQEARLRRQDYFLLFGTTMSATSKYKTTFLGKDAGHTDSDSNGFDFGVDAIYRFTPNIGMSVLVENSAYVYSDGTPADSILTIGLGPRGALPLGPFELWSSLIFAYGINRFGSTQAISNGAILTLSKSQSDGFEISPRIGADYDLKHWVKFRLQLAYSTLHFGSAYDVATYPGLVPVGPGSMTIDRSWLTLSGGIALQF